MILNLTRTSFCPDRSGVSESHFIVNQCNIETLKQIQGDERTVGIKNGYTNYKNIRKWQK
ncbi:hypothetical protein JM83_3362 [Gillisia sp. Hel_I_86]|nr:hypothetical protein JM83_3362 [Gillisia sp. Hel_I_86]